MATISTDDPITLDDGNSYQFVSQTGTIVHLKNLDSGDHVHMHIAALSQKVVGPPRTFTPDIRKFEDLSEKRQEGAIEMADHINEILTGVNHRRESPLPEYNIENTTQNQRIQSKIRELKDTEKLTISRATLHRRMKAYKLHGTAGLMDGRHQRSDPALRFLHPDVYDALCHIIAKRKDLSTRTKASIIRDTREHLTKAHAGDAPAMPSDASMYRYIDLLTKGKHTTGSAKTRQSLGNRPKGPYRQRTEVLPGAEVQIDSTTLDIFVRSSSGEAVRPILTVMFDRATRLILAFTLRLVAAKAADHVLMLAQALTPPQNRPDTSEFRAAVQRNNPDITLLSQDERSEYEQSRPFVHPRTIVMDNGKDFLGEAFIAALEMHGCDVRFSAPHTPTFKPLVERNFGSFNTLFCQSKPGYTGRSPEHRGYRVDEHTLMDIYGLHEVLDDWLLKVWNHRPHGGLRDAMDPSIVLTPHQKYTAAARITSNLETTLTRDDYIAMLPTVHRVVSDTGVQVNYRQFDSEELNSLRHRKSDLARKNGRHEVKLDPYNPFYAWVKNPDGGWIECKVRNADAHLYPFLEDRDLDPDDDEETTNERATVAAITAAVTGTLMPSADIDETPAHQTKTTTDTDDDVFLIDGNE